jgi:hypothetical protein
LEDLREYAFEESLRAKLHSVLEPKLGTLIADLQLDLPKIVQDCTFEAFQERYQIGPNIQRPPQSQLTNSVSPRAMQIGESKLGEPSDGNAKYKQNLNSQIPYESDRSSSSSSLSGNRTQEYIQKLNINETCNGDGEDFNSSASLSAADTYHSSSYLNRSEEIDLNSGLEDVDWLLNYDSLGINSSTSTELSEASDETPDRTVKAKGKAVIYHGVSSQDVELDDSNRSQ